MFTYFSSLIRPCLVLEIQEIFAHLKVPPELKEVQPIFFEIYTTFSRYPPVITHIIKFVKNNPFLLTDLTPDQWSIIQEQIISLELPMKKAQYLSILNTCTIIEMALPQPPAPLADNHQQLARHITSFVGKIFDFATEDHVVLEKITPEFVKMIKRLFDRFGYNLPFAQKIATLTCEVYSRLSAKETNEKEQKPFETLLTILPHFTHAFASQKEFPCFDRILEILLDIATKSANGFWWSKACRCLGYISTSHYKSNFKDKLAPIYKSNKSESQVKVFRFLWMAVPSKRMSLMPSLKVISRSIGSDINSPYFLAVDSLLYAIAHNDKSDVNTALLEIFKGDGTQESLLCQKRFFIEILKSSLHSDTKKLFLLDKVTIARMLYLVGEDLPVPEDWSTEEKLQIAPLIGKTADMLFENLDENEELADILNLYMSLFAIRLSKITGFQISKCVQMAKALLINGRFDYMEGSPSDGFFITKGINSVISYNMSQWNNAELANIMKSREFEDGKEEPLSDALFYLRHGMVNKIGQVISESEVISPGMLKVFDQLTTVAFPTALADFVKIIGQPTSGASKLFLSSLDQKVTKNSIVEYFVLQELVHVIDIVEHGTFSDIFTTKLPICVPYILHDYYHTIRMKSMEYLHKYKDSPEFGNVLKKVEMLNEKTEKSRIFETIRHPSLEFDFSEVVESESRMKSMLITLFAGPMDCDLKKIALGIARKGVSISKSHVFLSVLYQFASELEKSDLENIRKVPNLSFIWKRAFNILPPIDDSFSRVISEVINNPIVQHRSLLYDQFVKFSEDVMNGRSVSSEFEVSDSSDELDLFLTNFSLQLPFVSQKETVIVGLRATFEKSGSFCVKISVLRATGKVANYVLSPRPFMDMRFALFIEIMNSILKKDPQCAKRSMTLKTIDEIPICNFYLSHTDSVSMTTVYDFKECVDRYKRNDTKVSESDKSFVYRYASTQEMTHWFWHFSTRYAALLTLLYGIGSSGYGPVTSRFHEKSALITVENAIFTGEPCFRISGKVLKIMDKLLVYGPMRNAIVSAASSFDFRMPEVAFYSKMIFEEFDSESMAKRLELLSVKGSYSPQEIQNEANRLISQALDHNNYIANFPWI